MGKARVGFGCPSPPKAGLLLPGLVQRQSINSTFSRKPLTLMTPLMTRWDFQTCFANLPRSLTWLNERMAASPPIQKSQELSSSINLGGRQKFKFLMGVWLNCCYWAVQGHNMSFPKYLMTKKDPDLWLAPEDVQGGELENTYEIIQLAFHVAHSTCLFQSFLGHPRDGILSPRSDKSPDSCSSLHSVCWLLSQLSGITLES